MQRKVLSEIMLSIITPFFNQDLTVFKRTWESVQRAAKGLAYEWVIIMHNTDNCTPSDIMSLVDNTPEVKIFEKRDEWHSPCSPRNEGIKRSRGKYLYFLDDDDTCEPDFFEKAIQKMEAEGIDILMGKAGCEGADGKLIVVPTDLLFPETKDGYIVPDDPDIRGNLLYGAGSLLGTKLIRRKLVADNDISFDPEIVFTEDILFLVKCYSHAKKICVMTSLVAYTYIQRNDSLLQRVMGEDSFDETVYTVPLKRIVDLATANNISPGAHVFNMMGMMSVIYASNSMEEKKKKKIIEDLQQYISTINPYFPAQISAKRVRKEYLTDRRAEKQEVEQSLYELGIQGEDPPLYYRDISHLDEQKQIAFMKGFWKVLEGDGKDINAAAFVLGKDKTMIQLSMDRELYKKTGPEKISKIMMR